MSEKDIDGQYFITKPDDLNYVNDGNLIKYYCLNNVILPFINTIEELKFLNNHDYYFFKCKLCEKIHIRQFRKDRINEYKSFICKSCKIREYNKQHPEWHEKSLESNRRNHGGKHYMQTEEGKTTVLTTNRRNHNGILNVQTKEYRQLMRKKMKAHPEITIKAMETNRKNHGGKHNMQTKEGRLMMRNRNKQHPEMRLKAIESNRRNHGGKLFMQTEEGRLMMKNRSKQHPEWHEKSLESNRRNHDGKHYFQTENYKNFMYSRYGTISPNIRIDYYDTKLDSLWELAVWIYCIDHNIPIIRNPCRFKYYYGPQTKTCHDYEVDFYIDGIGLVEIKGDQFFDENGKMINPFDRTQDEKFEAKHQCGLQNNVLFWTSKDILPYIDYCNQYYPNWDIIYRKDNIYNPSYWCYYINNTYIPNYYNNSNYNKGIGISPYDIDSNDEYTLVNNKGISPFDIGK